MTTDPRDEPEWRAEYEEWLATRQHEYEDDYVQDNRRITETARP